MINSHASTFRQSQQYTVLYLHLFKCHGDTVLESLLSLCIIRDYKQFIRHQEA